MNTKSKIKVLGNSVFDKSPFPGSQIAVFFRVLTWLDR